MMNSPFDAAGAFYAWREDLTGVDRGTLLRSEPLVMPHLVAGASAGWRILYVSAGHTERNIAVSGLLYLPAGARPADGWPVISYAHGTTGITAAAAPSLNPVAQILGHCLLGVLPSFLEAGYAVVCSDYEGLGTAGPHPYLHGPSLANSQVDAVRASRQLTDSVSPVWVAMGQSEGGLATLFAAASATALAPELDYRGAVATAPPTEWRTLISTTTDLGRILTPLILHAATYHDSTIDIASWLNDDGQLLLDAWRTSFLQEPGSVLGTFMPLYGKPLLAQLPGEIGDAQAAIRLSNSIDTSALEVPRKNLDRPVLLAEGGSDEFCVPGTVARLADDLRDAGTDVDYHFYPDTGHLDVPYAALPDSLPFIQRIAPAHLPEDFERSVQVHLEPRKHL